MNSRGVPECYRGAQFLFALFNEAVGPKTKRKTFCTARVLACEKGERIKGAFFASAFFHLQIEHRDLYQVVPSNDPRAVHVVVISVRIA